MKGWVYILSNESSPGLVKIGFTRRDSEARAKELSSDTGVPTPFIVEYELLTETPLACERMIHQEMILQRVNENREFFRCSVNEAIQAVRKVAGDQILFERSRNDISSGVVQEQEISFPLIALIQYLLEDGDLTNHEVYHLCEWFNSNPEACDLWPAAELVEPLSEVYSDGVLTLDELHRISFLLLGIVSQAEEKLDECHRSNGGNSDKICVTRKGELIGSYSREKAKEYFASGQLLPTDWGWHDGMEDWEPLSKVLEIPPVLAQNIIAPAKHLAPERKMAQEREGVFGGLLQRFEQMRLDWTWKDDLEEFEEREKQRRRKEYIAGIIERISNGDVLFEIYDIVRKREEQVCWVENAILYEEVTRGPRDYRYKEDVQVDEGSFIITNERLIFRGAAKTFETRLNHLLAMNVHLDGITYHIRNRVKKKMIEFPAQNGDIVCAVLNHLGKGEGDGATY